MAKKPTYEELEQKVVKLKCFTVTVGIDRRRLSRFGIIFIFCIAALMAMTREGPGFAEDQLSNRTILAKGSDSYMPYSFLNEEGEIDGFNNELFQAVAEAAGLNTRIELEAWPIIRKELESGKIDVITGMYYSKEREKLVDLSVPHIIVKYSIFVRKDSEIKTLAELNGKEIIVMRGAISHDFLKKEGIAGKTILTKDTPTALSLLSSGKHDCALLVRLQGIYLMKKLEIDNVKTVGEPFEPRKFCFAVKEGAATLLSRLNEGLFIINQTGKYEEIYNKWFGILEPEAVSFRQVLRYVAFVLIPVLMLLLASVLWSWSLKRQVKINTVDLNHELSERKRVEENLKLQNEIVENMAEGVYLIRTSDAMIVYANETFERMFGYDHGELINKHVSIVNAPSENDSKEIANGIIKTLKEKGTWSSEVHNIKKDGTLFWCNANVSTLDHHDFGEVWISVHEDISERKKAEEELKKHQEQLEELVKERTDELRKSNEQLKSKIEERKQAQEGQEKLQAQLSNAVEMAHLGHWEYDVANDIFTFNDHFYKIFRTTAKQVGGYIMSSAEYARRFVHPDDILVVGEETRKAVEATDPHFSRQLEHRMLYADGTVGHITVRFFIVKDAHGQTVKTYGVNQDITERKQAEEALRESEEQFRHLSEAAFEGIAIHEEGVVLKANDQFFEIFGYEPQELLGKQAIPITIAPESIEFTKKQVSSGATTPYEVMGLKKDGTKFPVEIYAKPFEYQGRMVRVMALRDITERKQAEEEIRRSKKEWEDTFDAISDWICIIDTETHQILKSNSAVEKFLGVTSTDVNGQFCWNLFHGFDEPISGCPLKKMIQTHKRESMELKDPKTNQWISVTVDPVKDEEGKSTGAVHIVRNITERRKMETERRNLELQLLQSEKLASVGQLAAGIAHEINNPVGFITSNLATLKDYQTDITRLLMLYHKLIAELRDTIAKEDMPSSIEKQVEQIIALKTEVDIDFILNDVMKLVAESREGTERIKKIVLDLKDFAHPGEDKLRFADINKGLDSTLNVVWNELRYKATVTKDYGDLPEVQCYPQRLNQVFANLLVNAAQAIEKKGEIKIATRAIEGKVEICISDTGAGIPKEVLPKIFDSFFTTKDVGKGTGMGLNIAYNIIKQNKGTIEVHSTVGEGTTFTIRIPIAEAEEG